MLEGKEAKAVGAEVATMAGQIEGGESDRVAWVAIQDRVKRLSEGRTQTEVGVLVGQKKSWVSSVVNWKSAAAESPFANKAQPARNAASDHAKAKRVLRENPEKIVEALAEADESVIRKVATGISKNRRLRKATGEASNEFYEKAKQTSEAGAKEVSPSIVNLSDHLDAIHLLGKAERELRQAYEAVVEIDWEALPDGEQEARQDLLEKLEPVELLVREFLRPAIETGQPVDKQLAELLGDGS